MERIKMTVPNVVKITEMRRDWWIVHQWIYVAEFGSPEPVYIKSYPRPIEQAVEAAKQFDTMWEASLTKEN